MKTANRIRCMGDDELVSLFMKIQDDVAHYYVSGRTAEPELPITEDEWHEWLKSESKFD